MSFNRRLMNLIEETMPFWERMTPAEMSEPEWESLCDGCARCCVHKLKDEQTGDCYYTHVACRLLDLDTGRCRDYPHRHERVPECVSLDRRDREGLAWMPPTCAYRLLAEGKPLPDWHPLLTGEPDSTQEAGMSVCGHVIPEDGRDDFEYEVLFVERGHTA